MASVINCPKCGKPIKSSIVKGIVHIQCKACKTKYELDQSSVKKHMLIPFASVAFSVWCSMNFLDQGGIDVKFIFILALSFGLAMILSIVFVRLHILAYEEKE